MDALLYLNAPQPRQFRRINGQIDGYSDDEVRRRYRFGKDNLNRLEDIIGHRLERPTNRNQSLTPRQQILIALRFMRRAISYRS